MNKKRNEFFVKIARENARAVPVVYCLCSGKQKISYTREGAHTAVSKAVRESVILRAYQCPRAAVVWHLTSRAKPFANGARSMARSRRGT